MLEAIRLPGSLVPARFRSRLLLAEPEGWRATKVFLGVAAAAAALGVVSASAFAARDPEIEAFARQGISRARAEQALALQSRVAETKLASKVVAALGDAYAGVWFEPAAAKFHVGVTSDESRRMARLVADEAGLGADVVETPVRSTWSALLDTQTRWNQKLAGLIANAQAMTGLNVQRNAVEVTLSSSVPANERATLTREAASESVTVIVVVEPTSRLGEYAAARTCSTAFRTGEALCEEQITSGVNLWVARVLECTSGPMLIEGNETYMITAAHCYGEREETGMSTRVETASEYPAVAERGGIGRAIREVGGEVTRWFNRVNEFAEVRVAARSAFQTGLPTPVPALMAEWGSRTPRTPHAVEGIREAEVTVPAQMVCHEGMTTGEECGEVLRVNVAVLRQTMGHMVETSACSEGGDSGGPFFLRVPRTNEILMMGDLVAGRNPEACRRVGPYITWFEPLLEIPRVPGSGSLGLVPRQSLLTTANERRRRCPGES